MFISLGSTSQLIILWGYFKTNLKPFKLCSLDNVGSFKPTNLNKWPKCRAKPTTVHFLIPLQILWQKSPPWENCQSIEKICKKSFSLINKYTKRTKHWASVRGSTYFPCFQSIHSSHCFFFKRFFLTNEHDLTQVLFYLEASHQFIFWQRKGIVSRSLILCFTASPLYSWDSSMSSNASQCVALSKARVSKITSSLSRKEIFGFKISVGFILAKFWNYLGAFGRDFEEMILKYLGRKVQKVPKLGPKFGRQPLWLMISNPFRWNRLKKEKSYRKVFSSRSINNLPCNLLFCPEKSLLYFYSDFNIWINDWNKMILWVSIKSQ